ncbi:hypothetical protein [Allokutzneria sp. A3M-2-11 16]|uniref:hypothetical protein n=1 Tax=Allokutzneria sp. A3M-2-11 16 TaxID=2962043 RepID=UPI00273A6765|nr:hypothetical protein [Allokutzneria sp. A3M-2-11 16]
MISVVPVPVRVLPRPGDDGDNGVELRLDPDPSVGGSGYRLDVPARRVLLRARTTRAGGWRSTAGPCSPRTAAAPRSAAVPAGSTPTASSPRSSSTPPRGT